MAYETGTYSNPTDLLQKLAAFCENNGWTRDRNAALASGWAWVGHRGSAYVGIRANVNESATGGAGFARSWAPPNAGYALTLTMGSGYNSGATYWKWMVTGSPYGSDDTSGATYGSVGCTMTALGSGAGLNYDFFSYDGGDHIFAIVERSAGLFSFIGWGLSMIKYGSWVGGKYIIGSRGSYYWNAGVASFPNNSGFGYSSPPPGACAPNDSPLYFTCDADGSERWFSALYTTTPVGTYGHTANAGGCDSYDYQEDNVQMGNYLPLSKHAYFSSGPGGVGLQYLVPVVAYAKRGATTTYSPVGELPYQFLTRPNNVGNRTELTYGSDTYKFYPKFAVKKEV